MMSRLSLILVVSLFLCSCSGLRTRSNLNNEKKFYVEFADVSPNTKRVATDTIKDLNKRIGKEVISFKKREGATVIKITTGSDFDNWRQLGKTLCEEKVCLITLNSLNEKKGIPPTAPLFFWQRKSNYSVITIKNLIRHEIGHAIGLDHDKNPGRIMSEFAEDHDYKESDVREWAKAIKSTLTP